MDISISPTSGVQKPYNLYINTLRLLQSVYNHLTRLQQGRKYCKSMVFSTLQQSCMKQGCYNQKFPYGKVNFLIKELHRYGETHSQLSMCCWVSIMFLIYMFQHNFCHRLLATCVHVSAILHALVSITCSSQPNHYQQLILIMMLILLLHPPH